PMLAKQRVIIEHLADALAREAAAAADSAAPVDVVMLWRAESSAAALRFLHRLTDPPPISPT
ncbi:MAG: hypothetical protein JWM12_2729, partial [Ilumatobacteraceae bacterium]|nr:hypothetical protein [Ilumatobacteraceae bacterium]